MLHRTTSYREYALIILGLAGAIGFMLALGLAAG
jgi:hypothetical protein